MAVPAPRWLVPMAVVAATLAMGGCGSDDEDLADRRAEVAARGAEVMPFDLDATTHRFTKTADGGLQVVVAHDTGDGAQVERIRSHLAEERENFARGDFDDPAAIHGHEMDGVAALRAGYADIEITYRDRPGGAQLDYSSDDPALVAAIHAWFDRQVVDHGDHAGAG